MTNEKEDWSFYGYASIPIPVSKPNTLGGSSSMTALVAIIRSNPLTHDPRVSKIGHSLSKKYNVLLLGWDRDGTNPSNVILSETLEILRFPLRAPYGNIRLVLYYPLFWFWVLLQLASRNPSIIHACDFETLIPSLLFRRFSSSKVVFDSFDRYAMAFIAPRHRILYRLVHWLEDLLASKSDILITVSRARLDSFNHNHPSSHVILNCPRDDREACSLARSREKEGSDQISLVYAGAISRDRGLQLLAHVIDGLENVKMIVAGRVIHNDVLKCILKSNKVEYIGLISHKDALRLQAKADLLPLIYDLAQPINQVASPNKLFEAMMLGVPVISNVCRTIIEQTRCGIAVEYNESDLHRAICAAMRNQQSLQEMGKNGRIAFEESFNWERMERKLLAIYRQLSEV